MDRYKGVTSETLNTARFDENSDLSVTFVGKTSINIDNKISTEEKFPISEQGIQQKNYWTVLIGYYWIPELANHLCLNHTICIAKHLICYLNLLQKFRGSKYEMNSM